MYSDTGASAHNSFGGVYLRRLPADSAVSWSHGAKISLWAGLTVTSWAAVILAGYFLCSTL